MDTWISRLGLGVGVVALALVFAQRSTIGELQEELAKVSADAAERGTSASEVAEGSDAYDDTALAARVGALERSVADAATMRRAIARAGSSGRPRPAAAPPKEARVDGEGEVADEVTSLREDVDALLTGAGVQSDEGKKEIANLVKRVQQQERKARMARWTEFRKKADAEFIGKFAEEAGLDDDQVTGVTEALSAMRDAQMAARSAMRDGTLSFEEGRAKRRAIRETTTKALGEVMSAEQVESFTKQMQERRGRRGR